MTTPGSRLLHIVQREWVSALRDLASRLAADLATLEPDESFVGSAFYGRVLAPVDAVDPVLAVLGLLRGGAAPGVRAGIHGWRDSTTDGSPVGLAVVLASGPAVVAVTTVPDAGPALVLRAAGLAVGHTISLALPSGAVLTASGATADAEVEVEFPLEGPATVTRLDEGAGVELGLVRPGPGDLLGVAGGPSVRVGTVSAGLSVAHTPGDPFRRSGHLQLSGGEVALVPGFLRDLLPVDLAFPLDLDLRADPLSGITLGGSPALSTRLSAGEGRRLDITLGVLDAADGPSLDVSFSTALDLSLPGVPVRLHVEGLSLSLPVALRAGSPLLPGPDGLRSPEPHGADVVVDLPVVSGAGALARLGTELVGALAVRIPPLSASAYAVFAPPADGRPLSLLVILGATFPPPGIQIGFGFAISGVGGVVGINRRIDRDALIRAVTDGTAAQLLFPGDPVAMGPETIRALPAVFPASRGSVVAGPMFQVSWGGRVVTLSVAVLVEASDQVRLTILGKLVVGVPDPELPLVLLQATFAGIIDPAEPSVTFIASLTGSHIVGAPLSGDLLLLTRGGPDPEFILSAGGFHPAFPLPRGVPALRRLALDLCPIPWMEMRCESYFALTSNSLQLGARLELVAEVAGCGLRGWLAFDALIQFSPFRFIADVSGGVALRAFGETLAGVSLALHLEGPAPYLARGRGSIDLFLFEVSFDFEVGWGDPPAAVDPPPDVGRALRDALADPAAWRSKGAAPRGIVLTPTAAEALGAAGVVDPYGTITVQQGRVPLAVQIQRLDGLPVPAQRWDLTVGEFAAGEPAVTTEVRAQFAPGQFLAPRTEDASLTAPAFLPLVAGMALAPRAASGAEPRPVTLDWDEKVIAPDVPEPLLVGIGLLAEVAGLQAVLAAATVADEGWWAAPTEAVSVAAVPPAASAFGWSMAAGPELASSGLEMDQVIAGTAELMTVEAWELTR